MATGGSETADYIINWLEEPPDDLVCLICLEVATNPQQHGGNNGCGKVFCGGCITNYQQTRGTPQNTRLCPNCKKQLDGQIFPDPKSYRQIQALEVKCGKNLENGCPWTGELRELETHHRRCEYFLIPCTNSCTRADGEIVQMLKKDLCRHITEDCPRRSHKCPYCNMTEEYHRVIEHIKRCELVEKNCRHSSCRHKCPQRDLESHYKNDCQYELVACRYAKYGCKKVGARKDIRKHEDKDKHDVERVVELMERVKTVEHSFIEYQEQKERQIAQLQSQVNELTSSYSNTQDQMAHLQSEVNEMIVTIPQQQTPASCSPCIIRVTTAEPVFTSSSFYSFKDGYKMHIKVHIYGCGAGERTHVSVFAYLEQGDNDDSLPWPFAGTVKVELLNQLSDSQHKTESFRFSSDRTEQDSIRICGNERFIPCTNLGPRWLRRRQYRADDNSLTFRVSVQVSSYKAWLVPTMQPQSTHL